MISYSIANIDQPWSVLLLQNGKYFFKFTHGNPN